MPNPLVSVITPLYNRESLISETLDSLVNQTYQNWEAIVVDDGSTDNSVKAVEKYIEKDCRIKLFHRNREPKNASVCRNIGIEFSKGEHLIFLDSDDILAPNCLENRLEYISKNPELDFAVFQMACFNKVGIIKNSNIVKKKENYLYSYLSHDLPWAITCPFWKSSFVKKYLNGFNEKYPRLQDPEFNTRALMIDGVKFKVLDQSEPDCFYRNHSSKSFNGAILIKGFRLYIEEFQERIKTRADYPTCKLHLKSCFKEAVRSYYTYKKRGFNKDESDLLLSFSYSEYKKGLIPYQIHFLSKMLISFYFIGLEKVKFGRYMLRIIMKLIKLS